MKLTPQSIRNNVKITWNGEPISKQEIIDMSALWNEKQIVYFKKMAMDRDWETICFSFQRALISIISN